MKLSVWLVRKSLTQQDFARLIGVSQEMVSQTMKGRKKFGTAICSAIETLTKGQVKLADLAKDGLVRTKPRSGNRRVA